MIMHNYENVYSTDLIYFGLDCERVRASQAETLLVKKVQSQPWPSNFSSSCVDTLKVTAAIQCIQRELERMKHCCSQVSVLAKYNCAMHKNILSF